MKDLLSRITINPEACHGKPAIRNPRYPVGSMLEYLAGGDSIDDLLKQFPDLEREDLLACLQFAAESLKLTRATICNWHEVPRGCASAARPLRAVARRRT